MTRIPAIEFQNVGFSYGPAPVLEEATLRIDEGELACIVGPNGGGKTSLLKLIVGLLKPTSGRVSVFGQPPEQSRRRIGYMPQYARFDPHFPATVMDIVLMGRLGRSWGGPYSRRDRVAARRALAEMLLTDLAGRPFADLSGGQRQRALIARALAGEPDLLLLDEPTANVDAAVELKLIEFIRRLGRRLTILMVTHDLGFVSEIVQSVICVNRRVVTHPTSALTGQAIHDLYGAQVRMVHHDHPSPGGGSRS